MGQTTWDRTTISYSGTTNLNPRELPPSNVPQMEIDWVWMWLVNCIASLVCYFFARSSAKILVQRICYALPLAISTPILFGMVIGGCEEWNQDPCKFATNELSGYLFYKMLQIIRGRLGRTTLVSTSGVVAVPSLDHLAHLVPEVREACHGRQVSQINVSDGRKLVFCSIRFVEKLEGGGGQ